MGDTPKGKAGTEGPPVVPAENELTPDVTSAGNAIDSVSVSIGARFLELFSAQLYTSPNKAFEELISNSWDAGAGVVYVGIPEHPTPDSKLWVLDDGISMDKEGLELLWAVADDHKAKEGWVHPEGREQIGMFGIGKLATFVLANEVTYLCRGGDGRVLALTVDYRKIQEEGRDKLHVPEVSFTVREIEPGDLDGLLSSIDTQLPELIQDGKHVKRVAGPGTDDDQGGGIDVVITADAKGEAEQGRADAEGEVDSEGEPSAEEQPDVESEEVPSEYRDAPADPPAPSETWTLVVLGSLKDGGTAVRKGTVKRVVRASLPLGPSIEIVIDDELLKPTKLGVEPLSQLILGESFAPEQVVLEGEEEVLKVEKVVDDGRPALEVEGLPGVVTGEIKVYPKSIATGRSAERARSNGFFVNVKGRVVNMRDERFGMPAMSHGVWAKLRITIRADGLNEALSVSRETVDETRAVDALRGLLRTAFNVARKTYEEEATWPSLREILTNKWGTVPLTPLLHAVSRAVDGHQPSQMLIDTSNVEDPHAAHKELQQAIESDPGSTLMEVRADRGDPEGPLARYELATRNVVVNSEHPFYAEQLQGDHDPSEILQTAALVELLTDAYLLELGVAEEYLDEGRRYRDQVERLIARAKRRSAPMLAEILLNSTTDDKSLEYAVRDSLEALGFRTIHQGERGKPEGIATADLAPDADGERRYRFIYEAKSTTTADGKVSTKDVNISGQSRHRRDAAEDTDNKTEVEHALVVAPGFRQGALESECEADGVCPMRAHDLARLLMGTAATGPLDIAAFRGVLREHDPDKVARKIEELIEGARGRTSLTIRELVEALNDFDNVDQLSTGVIADRMRRKRKDDRPKESEVQDLIAGLQMLVPGGIQRLSGDRFILGTTPERLAEAVRVQASALPENQRFDLDQLPPLELVSEDDSGDG